MLKQNTAHKTIQTIKDTLHIWMIWKNDFKHTTNKMEKVNLKVSLIKTKILDYIHRSNFV
jgi:hypothetical protein